MTRAYDFKAMEEKWRPYWEEIDLYRTEEVPGRPYHTILDFFPYPSGVGLSVGHCRNYVPTCIAARYLRMQGINVLHAMGWDSFGLPAENYAIRTGVHPQESSRRNAANYKRQMKLIECSYDWTREIDSTDPDYYRWTQWFFLLLFRRGLAYRAEGQQWWCPDCQTILANEQVESGQCWRCGKAVTRKTLQQWYFRITAYAERLLDDLELVDWPESIKTMQRNWIGRSEGAEIVFRVEEPAGAAVVPAEEIVVFTTRPDTVYGATFLALAAEHPLARTLPTPERRQAVADFVAEVTRRTEIERQSTGNEKRGVFTGRHAIHPLTGERIPIWIADYVMMSYGSGSIMGVPAHDSRDHAFARRYALPVVPVVAPAEKAEADDREAEGDPFTDEGVLVNSGPYSGMTSAEAAVQITADLEDQGGGRKMVSYKLRDWLISRQRYWGAPIPIVHCRDCGIVPVPEEALPVELPMIKDFAPAGDGRSPLANAEAWVQTACPRCSGPARRETDTMDGFACSSWYFLRFASPDENERPFDPEAVQRWLPVDTYVGGAEHAVMHLLYARFWTKVMYDAGLIDFVEPFTALRNQGVLHAADGVRMSKSKGNVVPPDAVVAEHGIDALRAYIVFIGPFDASVIWDDSGIKGVTRFLDRFWRVANSISTDVEAPVNAPPADEQPFNWAFAHEMHRTIEQVTADMEAFKFNTALAAMMSWLNTLSKRAEDATVGAAQQREALETFALLMAPITPVITEAVWRDVLGRADSVHRQPWPTYDPALSTPRTITIAVQVNGRLRDTITVPAESDENRLQAAALESENVQRYVSGKAVRKMIVVPGRLVNIVV
ncbi:MAG: leucine--tRNA ligase [Candidatus Promineifilaceae bacterium]|nr:leucine--tRNA ligase [Candidatus Promineifilaceae bacterium]